MQNICEEFNQSFRFVFAGNDVSTLAIGYIEGLTSTTLGLTKVPFRSSFSLLGCLQLAALTTRDVALLLPGQKDECVLQLYGAL
jgi:hypothetical protein